MISPSLSNFTWKAGKWAQIIRHCKDYICRDTIARVVMVEIKCRKVGETLF